MNDMDAIDKIKNKLRKLKALADRGIDGEADTAQRLLAEVAEKYGIILDELDLEVEEQIRFEIKLPKEWQAAIFRQLVGLMRLEKCGDAYKINELMFYRFSTKHRLYVIHCTKAEWLELTAKYEVLARDYEKQIKSFTLAFLMRNDLLLPPSDNHDTKITQKERGEYRMAELLSFGIEKTRMNKQLGYER